MSRKTYKRPLDLDDGFEHDTHSDPSYTRSCSMTPAGRLKLSKSPVRGSKMARRWDLSLAGIVTPISTAQALRVVRYVANNTCTSAMTNWINAGLAEISYRQVVRLWDKAVIFRYCLSIDRPRVNAFQNKEGQAKLLSVERRLKLHGLQVVQKSQNLYKRKIWIFPEISEIPIPGIPVAQGQDESREEQEQKQQQEEQGDQREEEMEPGYQGLELDESPTGGSDDLLEDLFGESAEYLSTFSKEQLIELVQRREDRITSLIVLLNGGNAVIQRYQALGTLEPWEEEGRGYGAGDEQDMGP